MNDRVNLCKYGVSLRNDASAGKVEPGLTLSGYANLSLTRQNQIDDLYARLPEAEWENDEEEVTFFNEVMPSFFSDMFFAREMFAFMTRCVYKNDVQRKDLSTELLVSMEKFAIENGEFYLYVRSETKSKQQEYFSKSEKGMSRGFDAILGQLLANEKFAAYLKDQLNQEHTPSSLQWTGNKTDVMELVMSLHAAKVINHGKVELKFLATSVERMFGIKLHDCYDVAKKIRMRKINRTSFLDTLKHDLIVRLDDLEK